MDFAPYQDTPERQRALSPPPNEIRRSSSSFSPRVQSPTRSSLQQARGSPSPWAPPDDLVTRAVEGGNGVPVGNNSRGFGHDDIEVGRSNLNDFETSLPLRLDYEACLAYLLLPPAGGVLLLLLEHKSDYVRFHAWQSSLLFSVIFIIHLIFSWSAVMSWILFVGDIGLIGYLTMRAYRDADTLDRCEVFFFGQLANRFVDDE